MEIYLLGVNLSKQSVNFFNRFGLTYSETH